MAIIVIESGEGRGQRFAITDTAVIGRSKKNQIFIDDATMSRQHTKISVEEGTCVVTDLGSKNGTYLNGSLLKDRAILKAGDKLQIGKNVLCYYDEDLPKPHAPDAAPEVAVAQEAKEDVEKGDTEPNLPEEPDDVETVQRHDPQLREGIVATRRAKAEAQIPALARFIMGASVLVASAFVTREICRLLL